MPLAIAENIFYKVGKRWYYKKNSSILLEIMCFDFYHVMFHVLVWKFEFA